MDFKEKYILAGALNAILQTQEGCEKVDAGNNIVWFHVDCTDEKYEGLSDAGQNGRQSDQMTARQN
jgi:hypothetical protein